MSYLILGLLGLGLIALGVKGGGWALLLAWFGANLLALSIAHRTSLHRIFGKRPAGTLPLWSWLLFLPLHVYTLTVWHLARLFNREPAYSVVDDRLVVGRRLLASELDRAFDNYVDLTAEFAEPGAVRVLPGYRSFAILDTAAPTPQALLAAIEQLQAGRTYVHCALGHGRTGLFGLALLLKSGRAASVDEGLRMLQNVRPGVRLSAEQMRCIEEFARLDTRMR